MTNQATTSLWNTKELRNPHRLADKQRRVRKMFSDLAGGYDLGNRVLSLTLDRSWRKQAVRQLNLQPGQRVLDLCCGTGDLTCQIIKACPDLQQVVGLDFAEPMLRQAIKKYAAQRQKTTLVRHNTLSPKWLCANAETTALPNHYFDRIGCAFGIRNMQSPTAFLAEMYRLLKPGGRAVVLEFTIPQNPLLRWAYECYFRLVLPLLGSIISADRNRAYHYLAGSVSSFLSSEELAREFKNAGFCRVVTAPMCGGIVAAYLAEKPDAAADTTESPGCKK